MKKLAAVTTSLLLALALPGFAVAQSGLDQYQENVPGAGGDTGDTGGATGTDTGTGTTTDPSGLSAPTGTGTDGGTATGTSGTGTGLTDEEAANLSDRALSGQLPATGLDETLAMALVGVALIGTGFVLFRRVGTTA
jgi:LPXTG-motif cell wall-anchored protein